MVIWGKQLNRGGNFKMSMATKVCSNHFTAGYCSDVCRIPTLYLKGYGESSPKKRPAPTNRSSAVPPIKRSRQVLRSGFEETDVDSTEEVNICHLNDHDYDTITETECCARCIPHMLCTSCSKKQHLINQLSVNLIEKELTIKNLQLTIDTLQQKLAPSFSVFDIKENHAAITVYTGLQNYDVFLWLFKMFERKATKLHYFKGHKPFTLKAHQLSATKKKPGCKRKLELQNEFFFTLCRLRQGLTEQDLSYRFGISQSSVSTILSTWISFLAKEFERFIHWPTRDEVKGCYPKCFNNFHNVIGIIDCTEGSIEKPSLAKAQAQTYSSYKSKNTWKKLICVTPCGTVSFISKCYGGNASDRYITETCGILDKLNAHDNLMADKGFNISDLLVFKGCKLIIPPFLKDKCRFSMRNCSRTSGIAKARIHVERAIARIKDFRILQNAIPLLMKDQLDDIFIVCAAITNLAPPLVPL